MTLGSRRQRLWLWLRESVNTPLDDWCFVLAVCNFLWSIPYVEFHVHVFCRIDSKQCIHQKFTFGSQLCLPFALFVETCTSFYTFSGPKWLSSRVGILDTYQNTPSFVRFPSLDATTTTPLASTHCCQLAMLVAVWCNSPSVASTGPIFIQSENEIFVTTTSWRDSHRPTWFLNVCCCADNANNFPRHLWVKPHCRPHFERLYGKWNPAGVIWQMTRYPQ